MTQPQFDVVLSRWPGEEPEKRRREAEVAAALRDAGCAQVMLVPHLYYLHSDHPVVQALRDSTADLVVLSWMYPRAIQWVLHYDGVSAGTGRRVFCFDLRAARGAEELTAEIWRTVGAERADGVPAALVEVGDTPTRRWYPVLDFERCSSCLECIDFCLFGVYGIDDDGHVCVENPDSCKTDCPACSRVCPLDAIMFPECPVPLIAGAPDDSEDAEQAEAVQPGATVTLTLSAGQGDTKSVGEGGNKLDTLIDELDELDP